MSEEDLESAEVNERLYAALEGVGVSADALESLRCCDVVLATVDRASLDAEELGIASGEADVIAATIAAALAPPDIIFLDIDGVLNHPVHATHLCLEPEPLARLRTLLERTSAKIVLTTFWRDFDDYVAYVLGREGVRGVVGRTGGSPTKSLSSSAPHEEIAAFVDSERVRNYVILDGRADAASGPEQLARFVRVDPPCGLTDEDVDRACAILLRGALDRATLS